MAGVSVKFLLPGTDTPWQKVEELGWKDKIALKVDSRNPYRYAPNGLTVTKVNIEHDTRLELTLLPTPPLLTWSSHN